MSAVRLNITLPRELAQQLDEVVAPKKKSAFIADALRDRLQEIQNEKLNLLMKEGYKATHSEAKEMAHEFEVADLEGWDEY